MKATDLIIAFAMMALISGCATSNTGASGGVVGGPIPDDSKFAKVSIGMTMKEVFDTIGPATDTKAYATGKSFIPFYFGSDSVRSELIYKGEGRLTLTGGSGLGGAASTVKAIIYDPAEDGYNK